MAQKKQDIIKKQPDPKEVCLDYSFQHAVIRHAQAFGFSTVMLNVIEAYRSNARKYNKEANRLEQALKDK